MQDLMPPINTQDGIFHDGDPTTGQLGTIVTALWLNNVQAATRDVQAEIKNVLAKSSMTPDPKKNNQLADAISQIVSSGNYASTTYVDNSLNKKFDKANISGQKGNDNDKAPSLNLFTTEVDKLQPKGDYQPAGDYATNTALSTGLAGKLGTDAIVQSGGLNEDVIMSQKAVTDAFAKYLAKDQNGADIPDKGMFVANLGLGDAARRNVGVGENQIPDMSSFTASLSGNGWQKLPSGLIIQWGSYITTGNGAKEIPFPIAFPSGCVGLVVTRHQPGSNAAINAKSTMAYSFIVQDFANGDEVFSMIALGY